MKPEYGMTTMAYLKSPIGMISRVLPKYMILMTGVDGAILMYLLMIPTIRNFRTVRDISPSYRSSPKNKG